MDINVVGYIDYITADGDTFDRLALTYYNDEKMMSPIIRENPEYVDTVIFEQGKALKIPVLNNTRIPESLPPWRRNE